MFIKKITIKNFRLFPSDQEFEVDSINTPDGASEESRLNVFVCENGCGAYRKSRNAGIKTYPGSISKNI